MVFPKPELGLVFRYDYLWSREARKGRDTSKERPACIAILTDSDSSPQLAMILAIAHSKPTGDTAGIEIPTRIRSHIGLDDLPSWIIVSEHNVDDWPNPGIVPIPGSKGHFVYGLLPPDFYEIVRNAFLKRFDRNMSVRR